jgi:hypothetical protein
MQKIIFIFITIITLFAKFSVSATDILSRDVDPRVLCLAASSYYEKKYNIPRDVLRSISIVESGRWSTEHKMSLPSPWIVGIDGRGQFFNTYAEAAAFLRKAIAKGENVDIGCHQVNWKHHGHNFNKPEELLHPKHNAAYAAHFLVQKYNASKSWNKAIAHYHSHTPEFGNRYLKKVSEVLDSMRGPNGQKYAVYMKDGFSKIKQSNSLLYYHKDRVNPYKDYKDRASTTTPGVQIKKAKFQQDDRKIRLGKKHEIIVFSQNVELPSNSVIVDY